MEPLMKDGAGETNNAWEQTLFEEAAGMPTECWITPPPFRPRTTSASWGILTVADPAFVRLRLVHPDGR